MVSAKKVIITSFVVDVLDLITSFVVAIISGSVVMVAQTLEGAADLVSSGLLIFGLNRSLKHSDKNHPFGHGKELYFWTLISALFTLSISAGLSIYFGWQRFIKPLPISDLFLANIVLGITVLTNGYALFLSIQRLAGKNPKSLGHIFFTSPLIETRATFVLDFMGTSASILGLLALLIYGVTGDLRYDGLGAIAIGVVLAIMAFVLILGVKDLLVGRSVSTEVEEKIKKAALKVSAVEAVSGLKTNHIGPDQILVAIDIKLKEDLSTPQIEDIIERVKQNIRNLVKEASFIQVEIG